MTTFFNTLNEMYLGYAAIFICIGLGFLLLRKIDTEDIGPGYWSVSFFLNSAGFILWSGIVPIAQRQYFLLGEVAHILGFLLLLWGAYRFAGYTYSRLIPMALLLWVTIWTASILMFRMRPDAAQFMLKMLRVVLFVPTGILIIVKKGKKIPLGQKIAGASLIAWGMYTVIFAFLKLDRFLNLAFGFLVGFHVLAAFGMVAMVMDRIQFKVSEKEKRIERLEGLLPICSYCKKIRDKDDAWQTLESYIEDHSKAEFSHGICPDCFEKHRPDR
jgi:hypothetical protein